MKEKILEVKNLQVQFETDLGKIKAVNGVSFDVYKGKTIGIVGESGSGKTVTALSLMGLIPHPPGKILGGQILYQGHDLTSLPESKMRSIRGNKIAMIFQEPMTALNPVFTIGNQIEEVFALHQKELGKAERKEKVIEMLHLVGIPSPARRMKEFPHQISGGMRQRVMIAMALACRPDILIADEPTTALDVTIQAQILDLIKKLQEEISMGLVMVTHNFGVVAETCDEVAVMYCGRIVEQAPVKILFHRPQHPYTKGLMDSIPTGGPLQEGPRKRLFTIEGMVPSLYDLPPGCNFQNRCFCALQECREEGDGPDLRQLGEKYHRVACLNPLPHDMQ